MISNRKIRIALVSPKGPLYRHRGGIFCKSLRYQPLTLTTLAALAPGDMPCELFLFDEGIQDVPLHLDVDLVGLTVITGETGVGKTMLVTALGLLLGGRADSGTVRTGARSARIARRSSLVSRGSSGTTVAPSFQPARSATTNAHRFGIARATLTQNRRVMSRSSSFSGSSVVTVIGSSPMPQIGQLPG